MIAVVKNKEIPVNWIWQFPDGRILAEFPDEREIAQVVADWENAGTIVRISELEGDAEYAGANVVAGLNRERQNGAQVYQLTMKARV